ncbi:hypothetical protein CLOM_g7923 [Closterium sp. NIES-68]|nr:hypothetical protein CLOM_g7923 [Closterium sp. NIES-68]GJP60295.1 hypothetical protein CLOP_g17504 [Closterium sp. NIES-67]
MAALAATTLVSASLSIAPRQHAALKAQSASAKNMNKSVALRSHRRPSAVRCSAGGATAAPAAPAVVPAITLSEKALAHLTKMRAELNKDLLLRIGVRQGGCSGFSYVMDFEERANIQEGDSIVDYQGFSMVCDPKSLLFLFGMRLDYSDALIGGGFSFSNPNASSTCGCGKSFAA